MAAVLSDPSLLPLPIPNKAGNVPASFLEVAKMNGLHGDVSSTRQDSVIGDHDHFQNDLFDTLFNYIGRFEDPSDSSSGKYSIVNHKVFQGFKYNRFIADQEDKNLEFHITCVFTTFSEVAFTSESFANGTTTLLSSSVLGSIFRNQTFAPTLLRRASPCTFPILAGTFPNGPAGV